MFQRSDCDAEYQAVTSPEYLVANTEGQAANAAYEYNNNVYSNFYGYGTQPLSVSSPGISLSANTYTELSKRQDTITEMSSEEYVS